jgi:siroheme synthase (precorrin-2 oxidase/ferrochelatase)
LEFKNFATLLSGIPTEDFEKDGAASEDLDELLDLLCEKVTSSFDMHPHIVFMAKDNESLRNRLKKICDDRRKPYV